jgi:hypothetical protein
MPVPASAIERTEPRARINSEIHHQIDGGIVCGEKFQILADHSLANVTFARCRAKVSACCVSNRPGTENSDGLVFLLLETEGVKRVIEGHDIDLSRGYGESRRMR